MRRQSAEDDLIARYFQPLATHPGAFGLRDDAALLPASGDDLVITTDAIVAGVHFLDNDPPDSIARKALRVNLSDLAAKGARPAGFVLTLALPHISDAFLAPFAEALGEDAAQFGCPLLGGDTVATPGPLSISITAFGRVPPGTIVRRETARVGDRVMVTGTIGDAALGLRILKGDITPESAEVRNYLVGRYRLPEPRGALADSLRKHASAAMDVSDGLAGDLAKLCAASGASARVDAARVPLSQAARTMLDGGAPLELLMSGGDDYEIMASVAPDRLGHLLADARRIGIALTEIGEIIVGSQIPTIIGADGRPMTLQRWSYSHF